MAQDNKTTATAKTGATAQAQKQGGKLVVSDSRREALIAAGCSEELADALIKAFAK